MDAEELPSVVKQERAFDVFVYTCDKTQNIPDEAKENAILEEATRRQHLILSSADILSYLVFTWNESQQTWDITFNTATRLLNPEKQKYELSNTMQSDITTRVGTGAKYLPYAPGLVHMLVGRVHDTAPLSSRVCLEPKWLLRALAWNYAFLPNCQLNKVFTFPPMHPKMMQQIEQETIKTILSDVIVQIFPCMVIASPLFLVEQFYTQFQHMEWLFETHKDGDTTPRIGLWQSLWVNGISVLSTFGMFLKGHMIAQEASNDSVVKKIQHTFTEKMGACAAWFNGRMSKLSQHPHISSMHAELKDMPPTIAGVWTRWDARILEISTQFAELNQEHLTRIFHVCEVGLLKLSGAEYYKDEKERREANARGQLLEWPASNVNFGQPQSAKMVTAKYLKTQHRMWQTLLSPVCYHSLPLSKKVGEEEAYPKIESRPFPPMADIHLALRRKIQNISLAITRTLTAESKNEETKYKVFLEELARIQSILNKWYDEMTLTADKKTLRIVSVEQIPELFSIMESQDVRKFTYCQTFFVYLFIIEEQILTIIRNVEEKQVS